jgi:hypothetical protein
MTVFSQELPLWFANVVTHYYLLNALLHPSNTVPVRACPIVEAAIVLHDPQVWEPLMVEAMFMILLYHA